MWDTVNGIYLDLRVGNEVATGYFWSVSKRFIQWANTRYIIFKETELEILHILLLISSLVERIIIHSTLSIFELHVISRCALGLSINQFPSLMNRVQDGIIEC